MAVRDTPQGGDTRPSVDIILPAYNEEGILEESLDVLCRYMAGLEDRYRWQIVIVNDGSADQTGPLADRCASKHPNVTVLHHPVNFGMGQALITGFRNCSADYAITLDLDLSFSPDHIPALLARIRETGARIVVASPFAKGGRIVNVPWLRKVMSIAANWFLARVSGSSLTSITGVGRAYDGRFIRALNLKATGMDINAEVILKAQILQARIVEIPASLDWKFQLASGPQRRSKMRVRRHILSTLVSGFLLRPAHFFFVPGLVLLAFSAYTNIWMLIHWWYAFRSLGHVSWIMDRASDATRISYSQNPHTFVIGGLSAVLALQILGLAFLSLQQKKYFDELFHLGTVLNSRGRDQEHS